MLSYKTRSPTGFLPVSSRLLPRRTTLEVFCDHGFTHLLGPIPDQTLSCPSIFPSVIVPVYVPEITWPSVFFGQVTVNVKTLPFTEPSPVPVVPVYPPALASLSESVAVPVSVMPV